MAAKPAQQRTMLTLADRIAYQRAIEEVYWRHRIWPKERPDPKPSFDGVMPPERLEKKVEYYLRSSQALEDYWQRPLSAEQLQAEMNRMAKHTKQPEVLREIFGALGNDPFVIAECLARPVLTQRLLTELNDEDRVKATTVAWRKEPLRSLVARAGTRAAVTMAAKTANYTLPEISSPSGICTDDTWTPTSVTNAPSARGGHTAVWTGSEMIVWGGYDSFVGGDVNTGGRYNPSTDSWTTTSTTNAPSSREEHTAVWTGSEMIVWGGFEYDSGNYLNTGGRYNPSTDSWTATSTTNAPHGREDHTVVWTGSQMIVWGGYFFDGSDEYANTGGKYNPGTDSWTATSTTNAPSGRDGHTAVWSGSEMIVWGGTNNTTLSNTGGRYNPSTNSWTPTSTMNAPASRFGHTAVWTGSEMIVWGGASNTDLNTGGRYNPGTDSWTATSTINAPGIRIYHTAIWTGNEMVVWGGYEYPPGIFLNTGGRYTPSTDSWTVTSTTNAPAARGGHTAVWTESEMIVWGAGGFGGDLNTGGRYCAQSQAPMAQSAFSRKTHGAAGTFDVPLPLTGNVGIECRSGGATNDYQMIINFATTVTVGSASVTSGTGSVGSFTVSGPQVSVNLTGVINIQRITVTLMNVNDGTHMGNVPVSMGVLVGDVNGNAIVNASDVSLTKSQVGVPVSSSNFREDVNANGVINSVDVALVKAKVGTALPP
jgi:N-acetylneuraminic acid mutarotase